MKKIAILALPLLLNYSISAKVIPITNSKHLEQELSEGKPVIIDFYADWCGPCQQMKPIYEQVSAKHPEIKFLSVNGDQIKELINKYQIKSYPTFLFINAQGQVVLIEKGASPTPVFFDEGIRKLNASCPSKQAQKPAMQSERTTRAEKVMIPEKAMEVRDVANAQDFITYVANSSAPVFVQFYMQDCASCKAIEKAIKQLVEEFGANAQFVRIKVDQEGLKGISQKAGVLALPSYTWLITEKDMGKKFSDREYTNLYTRIEELLK